MPVTHLEVHPLAQLFPLMAEDEYEALRDDIERNGLLEPIWLSGDGKIVDGRHRYRACEELGREPETLATDYGERDLPEILMSLNMRRRHLNESQRAMVAARLKPYLSKEARARMGHPKDPVKRPKPEELGQARDHAAAKLLVSARSVTNAEKVLQHGVPELIRAVDNGTVAVSAAAKAAKLSEAEQRAMTARVVGGEAKNMSAALRQNRLEKAAAQVEALAPVEGSYHVIVVDPPWRYNHRLEDETHRGRTPYPTMTEEEIRAIEIPAADDCTLWLWATNAYLADGTAARVCQAWGFQPKTVLTWCKPRVGVGDWLRGQSEHAILAIRGRPCIKDPTPSTILQADAGEHSQKPQAFFDLVEAHCPGRRLEMFACTPRPGWDQHGAALLPSDGPALQASQANG